jgi:hypothetical protein
VLIEVLLHFFVSKIDTVGGEAIRISNAMSQVTILKPANLPKLLKAIGGKDFEA